MHLTLNGGEGEGEGGKAFHYILKPFKCRILHAHTDRVVTGKTIAASRLSRDVCGGSANECIEVSTVLMMREDGAISWASLDSISHVSICIGAWPSRWSGMW